MMNESACSVRFNKSEARRGREINYGAHGAAWASGGGCYSAALRPDFLPDFAYVRTRAWSGGRLGAEGLSEVVWPRVRDCCGREHGRIGRSDRSEISWLAGVLVEPKRVLVPRDRDVK